MLTACLAMSALDLPRLLHGQQWVHAYCKRLMKACLESLKARLPLSLACTFQHSNTITHDMASQPSMTMLTIGPGCWWAKHARSTMLTPDEGLHALGPHPDCGTCKFPC